jgi:hypothetical protein
VESWAATILKISFAALIISLVYLLYGVFNGDLAADASGHVEPRIVNAITIFGQILAISSGSAVACFLLLTLDDVAFALIAGVYGLLLLLGTPFLVASNLQDPQNPAGQRLNTWGTVAGEVVIVLVVIRIIYEIYRYVRNAPAREVERQTREGRPAGKPGKATISPGVLQKCWQMPFCHQRVKEICPAFKSHKTCWRYGRGCNCDAKLIEDLIRLGGITGRGTRRDSQTQRTQWEFIRSDLEADRVTNPRDRTIPCAKCAIYNEHQRQKFRLLNPVAVALTVALMALLYRPLTGLYSAFIEAIARLAASFSYGASVAPAEWFGRLDHPAVQVFFFAMLFLLALAYVLKFVEWAVLVKKW